MLQIVLLRMFLISLFTFIIWRISHLSVQYPSRISVQSTKIKQKDNFQSALKLKNDGSQVFYRETQQDPTKLNFSKKTNKTLLREKKFALRSNPDEIYRQRMKGNKSSISKRYYEREKALMGNPYSIEENRVKRSSTSWEDFINSPIDIKPRNRQLISSHMLSSLLSCPSPKNTSFTGDRCSEVYFK